MTQNTLVIKDAVLTALLPEVVYEGWRREAVEKAALDAGYDVAMARAVFPGGVGDVLDHFADFNDRRMLAALAGTDPESLRIRDRVQTAVLARLDYLREFKEAERLAVSYWSLPSRSFRGGKMVWRTADRIWDWAGDTATDYNRYTKRGLLSGVLGSTLLVWLDDESPDMQVTRAFLARRIENVMQLGKFLGKIRKAA